MGAGSSTEQRSPEQPEAGSATPAEPEPSGGGSAAEAAPGTPGDPAIAPADPATKVGALRATCLEERRVGRNGGGLWGEGEGEVPSISACSNFLAGPAHLQTREPESLFLGFSGF